MNFVEALKQKFRDRLVRARGGMSWGTVARSFLPTRWYHYVLYGLSAFVYALIFIAYSTFDGPLTGYGHMFSEQEESLSRRQSAVESENEEEQERGRRTRRSRSRDRQQDDNPDYDATDDEQRPE